MTDRSRSGPAASFRAGFSGVQVAGILLALIAVTGPVRAGELEVSTRLDERSSEPSLRVEEGRIRLLREEVLRWALERNLGLRVGRLDRARGELGVLQARGAFDLGLGASVFHLDEESPAASNLDGAEVQQQKRSTWNLGISRLLPWGGTATAQWSTARLETNSRFALLNPSYSSGFDLSLSQPLLRGFGREATEATIVIAQAQDELAQHRFEQQVVALVQAAENAYWAVVGARAQLLVAEQALALARELHENNKVRVQVGTLAPLELVQSEAGVALREEEILRVRAAVADAEDQLRSLLDLPPGPLWELPIEPESPLELAEQTLPLAAALDSALGRRIELKAQSQSIRALEVEQNLRREELKPQLNLTVGYGVNGVGGRALLRNPDGSIAGASPGGVEDAWEQLARADFPGWSVGLDFRYPLENRAARARAALATIELERARTEQERVRLQIATEVRAALRAVETARQQIASARVSVRLEEKNLEAELKRLENGLSTSFQILQVQERLTAARSRLVAAQTEYRRAVVEYHRSIGDLLEVSGVRVSTPGSSGSGA